MQSFNDSLKDIRKSARKVGLVFKKTNTRLNGAYLYQLVCKRTGNIVISNYQFNTAFNDSCSGFIGTWTGYKFMPENGRI